MTSGLVTVEYTFGVHLLICAVCASCLISRKVVDSPVTMKVTDMPLVLQELAKGELR